MSSIIKKLFIFVSFIMGMLALGGCAILEEDPNEQQIPWATPANWEGQVPGMPNQGGY
jgi:hypothetical protein